MKPAFSWSIRTLLLLLTAVIIVPTLAIVLFSGLESQRHEKADARRDAVTTANLIASLQERVTDGAEQLLTTLARLPQVQNFETPSCNELFAELLRQNPQFTSLVLQNAEGDLVASGVPTTRPINNADRTYFKEVVRTRRFVVGEYVVTRITGKAGLHYASPILNAEGHLLGVVSAGLDIGYYQGLFSKTQLPPGSVLVLDDQQGTILYRTALPGQTPEGQPDKREFFKIMSGDRDSGSFQEKGIDGVERLYGYTRLRLNKTLPPYMYLRVGIPVEVALAEATGAMQRNLIYMGALVLLGAGLTWLVGDRLIVRRVQRLAHAARRLAQGNPELRLGFQHPQDELGQLAGAFDKLEAALAAREGRQRQVQESLLDERSIFIGGPVMFFRARLSAHNLPQIVYASPNVQTLIGYPPEDLLSGKIELGKILHPEDAQRMQTRLRNFAASDQATFESEYRILPASGAYHWLSLFGMRIGEEESGAIVVHVYAYDITARKEAEEKLRHTTRALRAITECNQAVARATDEISLLDDVCRNIVDLGGYRMAWVGYIQQDEEKTIRPMAHAGHEAGYLDRVRLTWAEDPKGEGPGGVAVRTGQPCVINDIQTDPTFAPWREMAGERGYAAVAGLPLVIGGRPVGVLLIYSATPQIFDTAEVTLLSELADDLAFGIGSLRAKVRQKQMEQALRTERSLFVAGPIMVFRWKPDAGWPVEYVSTNIKEQLGYAPEEFLNGTIIYADLIHPEDLPRVRTEVEGHIRSGVRYFEQQYRLRRSGGEYRWVTDFNMLIRDVRGAVTGIYGYLFDITERKQTEEAIAQHILTLTAPEGDTAQLKFEDLFNLEEIQKIQDAFAAATGVASVITRPDGTPITTPSNFCRLCQTIRKTEKGLANCIHSDAHLGRLNAEGPTVQPCLSAGLWDAGTAIMVGERHIANWMIGQVLDQEQNEAGMLEYARTIGADLDEYTSALREVTRMPRAQFEHISRTLHLIVQQLSRLGLQNVQQAREITRRLETEAALRVSEAREKANAAELEAVLNAVPAAVWIAKDPACRTIVGNRAGTRLLKVKSSANLSPLTPAQERQQHFQVVCRGRELPAEEMPMQLAARENREVRDVELDLVFDDGAVRTVIGTAAPLRNEKGKVRGAIGAFVDITERKQAEAELREQLARDELLSNVAANLLSAFEDIDPVMDRTLMLIGLFLRTDRSYLFIRSADGTEIDNTHEWCADGIPSEKVHSRHLPLRTLPWLAEQLHASDLVPIPEVNELPAAAAAERALFEAQGIRSLLLVPIMANDQLVGFFGFDAVRQSRRWNPALFPALKMLARMMAIAMERQRREETLATSAQHARASNEMLQQVMDAIPQGICWKDRHSIIQGCNRNFAWLNGFTNPQDLVGKASADLSWSQEDTETHILPMDRRVIESNRGEYHVLKAFRRTDGFQAWLDITKVPLHDEGGQVKGVLVAVEDVTERQKSEKRYQAIVEAQTDALCRWSPDGRITFVNEGYCQLYGRSREELLGLPWLELALDTDRAELNQIHASLVAEPRSHEHSHGIVVPERGRRWFHWVHSPIYDPTGNLVEYQSVGRDITEKKELETRLQNITACFLNFGPNPRENIGRLTALCGELLGGAWAVYNRREGNRLSTLGEWQAPADMPRQDRAAGHLCTDVIPSDQEDLQVLRHLPETPYAQTDPNVRRYGLETCLGRAVRVAGQPVGALCVTFQQDYEPSANDRKVMDILAAAIGIEEQRRETKDAIIRARDEWELTFNAIPDLVAILDPEHRIVRVNQAMAERLRAEPAALAGLRCFACVHQTEAPPEYCPHDRMLADGRVHSAEVHEDRLGGDFLITTSPLRDTSGQLAGSVHIAHDITARKRTEKALAYSERQYRTLFEEMSSGFALHEILCDAEGKPCDYRFLQVNPAFEQLTGLKAAKLIGKTVKEVLPETDPEWIDRYGRVALTGEPIRFEQFNRTLNKVFEVRAFAPEKGRFAVLFNDISKRKRTLASLKRSVQLFRSYFDLPLVGIAVTSPEKGWIRVNDKLCAMLGYTREELKSQTWAELTPPAVLEYELPRFQQILNGDLDSDHYEKQFVRKDGHVIDVTIAIHAVRKPDGTVDYLVAVIDDITEHKRHEEQSRMAEGLEAVMRVADELLNCPTVDDLYRRAVELARAKLGVERCGIFILDGEKMRGTWGTDSRGNTTDEHALILDTAEEKRAGRLPDFVAAAQKPMAWDRIQVDLFAWENNLKKTVKQGWLVRTPIAQTGQLPQAIFFNDAAITNRECDPIQQDSLAVFCSFLAHLIELKQTEEALRDSEEKIRAMTASAQDAIIMMDDTGQITFWNPSAERILGYREAEARQRKAHHLLMPEQYLDRFSATFPRWSKTGQGELMGKTVELSARHKDGREIPVKISLSSFQIKGRWNAIAIIRDLSDRKRMETVLKAKEEAESANQAKSTFLANMSHEIRTPMNGVLGMVELLLSTTLNAEQREYVQTIYRSGEALLTILNDILDMSRIESGRIELEQIPFDVATVVKDVVELYRPRLEGLPVEMAIKIDPELPHHLVGDPARLRQVLGNVLSNAVKFTHKGHIHIRVKTLELAAGKARFNILVADTGIGIPANRQKSLFQPFTQADPSTTRFYGGTGLGLANAKGLIELMGGTIRVASKVGTGTIFTIELELPLDEQEGKFAESTTFLTPVLLSSSIELFSAREKIPARVLLVEDNVLNQTLAAKILTKLGAKVTIAGNGREALEKLNAEPLDLVFMDCQMPEMDGFEATARIRAKEARSGGHLPIIAMTAHAMKGDRERCLAAGMDDYVSKPVKTVALHQMLRQWWKPPQPASGTPAAPARPTGGTVQSTAPARPPTPATGAVLDPERFAQVRELFESKTELNDTVLLPFLRDLAENLAKVSRLIAEKNAPELEKAAHKLKGSAANIGAPNLARLASDLEQCARHQNLAPAPELGQRLEKEAGRVRKEIEKMLG